MRNKTKHILLTILLLANGHIASADPWFTGPLLALAGETMAPGQGSIEIYSYYTTISNIYDRSWNKIGVPTVVSKQFFPDISYGLINNVDIEVQPIYVMPQNEHATGNNIGDTTVILGFQVLREGNDHAHPNLRLTLQEIFPTGLYDHLDPKKFGTDASGTGSYQTSLGLNFEHLASLTETHYLDTYLSLTYNYAASVPLNGLSVYGGNPATKGRIAPGNSLNIDAAGELSLTQNWVAVMEGFFLYQQASSFTGSFGHPSPSAPVIIDRNHKRRLQRNRIVPTRHNIGGKSGIGGGNSDQFTLAPAIEYNFSDNYGIIGGVIFTVAGKNTASYSTATLAFNASW